MWTQCRGIFFDLFDRGTHPNAAKHRLPDLWTIGVLILSGAVSFSDLLSKFLNGLLGISGSIVPLALLSSGLAWAIHVIVAKQHESGNLLLTGILVYPVPIYYYDQVSRLLGKIGILILLVLLPWQVVLVVDEFVPLPITLYGYLIDAKTRQPVEGTVLRIVNGSGVDVTRYQLPSESLGLSVQRVRRNAKLVVSRPDCSGENELPLFSAYESREDALGNEIKTSVNPVFRYTFYCGASK